MQMDDAGRAEVHVYRASACYNQDFRINISQSGL